MSDRYEFDMELRDYFAGQALAGLLAHPQVLNEAVCADIAYRHADSMMSARSEWVRRRKEAEKTEMEQAKGEARLAEIASSAGKPHPPPPAGYHKTATISDAELNALMGPGWENLK